MRIKQLSFLVCGAMVAIFVLISYVTSELVVTRGVDAIERRGTAEKMRQLRNYMHTGETQLGHLALDWACWDDAYRFMQDKNEEFISINLRQSILEKLSLSSIGYYNADETLAAMAEDGKELATQGKSPELSRQCGLFAAKLLGGNEDGLSGIIMVNGVPHIVAAHKIRDTAMVLPSNGAVVMTRVVDAAFIAEVERSLLLRFSLLPVSAFADAAAAAEDAAQFKTVRDGESISSYSVIHDVFGHPAFCLHLVSDRAIAQLGGRMFVQNFVLIIISGIGMLIAFLVFTEKRILRRILSMQRQTQHIQNNPGSQKRISISGKDEIFDLSMRINGMIDTLHANDRFLQQTLDMLQAGVITIDPVSMHILSVNAFARKFIGLPQKDIVGKPCHQFICPNGLDMCPITSGKPADELFVGSLKIADGTPKTIIKCGRAIELNGKKIYLESFVDITDIENIRNELHRSEERYKTLFMNTGTATAVLSSNGLIFLINMEFSHLVGMPSEEIEKKLFISHFLQNDGNQPVLPMGAAAGHSVKYEAEIRTSDGRMTTVIVTCARIPNSGLAVISLLDISERSIMEKELAYRANHDLLTGLANKVFAEAQLQTSMRAARANGAMGGVLFIDLDRFKQVNDSFGHSLGDKLLRQAAERLARLARKEDCVARTGGDEFLIVAGGVATRNQLEAMAKNALLALNRCFYVEEYSIYLSASIGIACFPDDGDSVEALVQSADLAMYRSKEKGKNTYTFFTEDLTTAVSDRMALETELFRAMDNDAFEVHYQPKINVVSGVVEGCEALLRWQKPRVVPPSVFVPLAEEIGLVRRLDMFVLRTACRQWRTWSARGCAVPLAVNMSGRSIVGESFAADVLEMLEREDVPPGSLGIEITETAFMANLAEAASAIAALHEKGVRIYLDDFGTGYSSLYYLHTMPIACLKIDKKFIDGINAPANATNELVKTVVTLAASLGKGTVAEGVETREQLAFLMENGCSVVQGHIFSPALSEADFLAFLLEQRARIAAVLEGGVQ